MSEDIHDDIINSIVIETVSTLPQQILDHYRNLPGRRPPESLKRIAAAITSLSEECAYDIIQDVVDSSVFVILNLIDSNFKEKTIETSFTRSPQNTMPDEVSLTERYRMKVDPGGLVYEA